ncbi:6969_t:CDS:2 [Rhizophagus irregularis]|nr:6969_t:CDS:2 [Rhizophagus irregularis]
MGLEDLVRNNYKIDFTNQKCFLPYASTSVNAIVCIKDVSTIQYFNPTYVTPSVTATSVAQNQQIQAWGKKSQNKYMFFTEFLNISDKLPPPHITDTSDGTPKKIGAQELKEMILDQVRDKKVAKQILASKQEDERERQEQIQVLRQTPLPLAEQSQSGMQLGGLISLRKCNVRTNRGFNLLLSQSAILNKRSKRPRNFGSHGTKNKKRNRTTKPQTTKFVASLIQEAETTIEVEEIKERYAKKEEIEQPNDQIITLSK